MALARDVYASTNGFPREETLGLKMQIRRAVVSIPANIAEGHGRLTDLQYRHFLGNARGSLCELQTELELAHNLGFVDDQRALALLDKSNEVARRLNGLISAMSGKNMPDSRRADTTSTADSASHAGTAKRLP
jgi:four helix bundle protein